MALIPYLVGGESITAERMNTIFGEFDGKVSALMGNKSILLLRPWGAGGETGHGSFGGTFVGGESYWEGQVFFFLGFQTDNITTTIEPMVMAGIDRPLSHIFHQNPNYVAYNHEPFEAAAAATPESATPPSRNTSRKIVRLAPVAAQYFNAIKRPNFENIIAPRSSAELRSYPNPRAQVMPEGRNSLFRFSLECHTKLIDGEPWFVMEDNGLLANPPYQGFSIPIFDRYTVSGLCPRMDWQQVELIFDGITSFNFPAKYNRFRFFRIHNFNQQDDLTVNFIGTDGLVKHVVSVPKMQSICVRRDTLDNGYLNGWQHFQRFKEGDPRFYQPNEHSGFFGQSFSAVGASRGLHLSNNVVNPSIIYTYVDGALAVHPLNAFPPLVIDPTLWWDAKPLLCNPSYPSVPTEGIHPPPAGGGYYGDPDDDATLVGDLIYHRGVLAKCTHVIPTVTETVTVLEADKVNYIPLGGGRPIKASIVIRRDGVTIPSEAYSLQFCTGPDVPAGLDLDVEPGNVNCFVLKPASPLLPNDVVTVTFEKVGATNSEEVVFKGFKTLVTDFAASGITVAEDSRGQLTFTGECDLMHKSTNLLLYTPFIAGSHCNRIKSLRGDRGPTVIHNLATELNNDSYPGWENYFPDGYVPNLVVYQRYIGFNELLQLKRVPTAAERYSQSWGTFLVDRPIGFVPKVTKIHVATVGEIKRLNFAGHPSFNSVDQSSPSITVTDRFVRMTPFGPYLFFKRKQKISDWVVSNTVSSLASNGETVDEEGRVVTQQGISLTLCDSTRGSSEMFVDAFSRGWSTSPRMDMVFGKRTFPLYNEIPDAATLFAPSEQLANPNLQKNFKSKPFAADWTQTLLGESNNDDKIDRIRSVEALDGFAFADRFLSWFDGSFALPWSRKYSEDNTQIIAAYWQNNKKFSHQQPNFSLGLGSQPGNDLIMADWSQDFSVPNDWYRTNRNTLLAFDIGQGAPGAVYGIHWMNAFFHRSTMSVEEYNKLASKVNGIVAVREYSFQDFYKSFLDGNLATSGSAGVFPKNQYAKATRVPPLAGTWLSVSGYTFDNGGYFDKFVIKKNIPLSTMPVSYLAVANQRREMKGWVKEGETLPTANKPAHNCGQAPDFNSELAPAWVTCVLNHGAANPPDLWLFGKLIDSRIAWPFTMGGPTPIAYTYDSVILTNLPGYPGDGKIRLDSSQQNAATKISFSILDANGRDWTTVLAEFAAQQDSFPAELRTASPPFIRLSKAGDSTKWLTFNVGIRWTFEGFRELALTNTGYSHENPFDNEDDILLELHPPGGYSQHWENYRYISIAHFTEAAETTGFKVRWSRLITPLKIDSFDISWTVLHGTHEERHSEHVGTDLKFAGFRDRNDPNETTDFDFAIAHGEPSVIPSGPNYGLRVPAAPPNTLPSWPNVYEFLLPTVDFDFPSRRWTLAPVGDPQRYWDVWGMIQLSSGPLSLAEAHMDGFNPLSGSGGKTWFAYKFTLGANGDKWMKYDGRFLNKNVQVEPLNPENIPPPPFGQPPPPPSVTLGLVPYPLNAYPGVFVHRGIAAAVYGAQNPVQFPDSAVMRFEVQTVGVSAVIHSSRSINWEYNNYKAADSLDNARIRGQQERPYTMMTSAFNSSNVNTSLPLLKNHVYYNDVVAV